MGTGEFAAGGNPAMDKHPIQGGVEILLVTSCYGNRDKLRPDGPLGSYADFTLPFFNLELSHVSVRRMLYHAFHFSLDLLFCHRVWPYKAADGPMFDEQSCEIIKDAVLVVMS